MEDGDVYDLYGRLCTWKYLEDNGGVTRGVCETDAEGNLIGIHETSNIVKTPEGAAVKRMKTLVPVDVNSLVSMNMWGLTARVPGFP